MRMNDQASSPQRWTNAKLFKELMNKANLESFSGNLTVTPEQAIKDCDMFADAGDTIREATRLYRQSWMNPLIKELARRMKVTLPHD